MSSPKELSLQEFFLLAEKLMANVDRAIVEKEARRVTVVKQGPRRYESFASESSDTPDKPLVEAR